MERLLARVSFQRKLGMTQARVIPKANEKPTKTDTFTGSCSQSCSCVDTTHNKTLFFTRAVRTVINGEESHCPFSVSQSRLRWRCVASQGGVVSSEATCFLLLPSKATSSPHNPMFNLPACHTAEVKCEEGVQVHSNSCFIQHV